uniref:Reverse transcriptase zinc-binding domain-containing protein n=1 Tax=Lactuca sativa TaxID=4236 RepID=A0A9R1WPF1_LACSA|nr:hypothetical protein LSAT_V11C100039230 [Lactuca sativa]
MAPIKVIKTLEKIRTRFFWGGDLESRKMPWIAWEKVLAAKERGGLRIGSLKAHNIALLGKWWWKFKSYPDSTWAEVWSLESSGVYSVASLRIHIDTTILPISECRWSWNYLIPGKLNILAWRICHGKLPSMVNLLKLGISLSNLCKMCNGAPETEEHVFVDCPVAHEVWQQIAKKGSRVTIG